MCGIAGKLYFDRHRSVDRGVLERVNAALAHRGPDDKGVYLDGAIGLTHQRLSIIDLSPAGHQPMSNADKTCWITFNGEIYNFAELRARLAADGVTFRSRTDTEVILALYDRMGSACFAELRGMFAIALWDGRRRTLVLARDRIGKKPLYYYMDREMVVFGSEPKALLADPAVPAEPDFAAIHEYMTYGYVPAPGSAFRGFRRVPPAHYLEIAEGRAITKRYWRLDYGSKVTLSEPELCEALLAQLRDAVRLRMVADVPIGAFLSGGVDSSAVVALMAESAAHPVKTFSIGFEEDSHNELPYARMVAERYGTDHHEFVVKPDAVAVLPEIVWHYNEPYADSSAVPTYYLAQLARRHVTVALNGDAGDENFAGYERYRLNQLAARYDKIPRFIRRPLEASLRDLPDLGSSSGLIRRLKRFGADAGDERRRRYGRWVTIFSEPAKARLYTPEFRAAVNGSDPVDVLLRAYAATRTHDVVDATLGADVATYLPDDLLVKIDIATMAHALEARSPMVDHRFMEFAASIPSALKLKGGITKHIFKRAVRHLLPPAILERPKQGFGVPLEHWFREPLRDLTRETLLGRRSVERGLFDAREVERLLDEHVRGRSRHDPQLWTLLMLELWFQRFIDASRPVAA